MGHDFGVANGHAYRSRWGENQIRDRMALRPSRSRRKVTRGSCSELEVGTQSRMKGRRSSRTTGPIAYVAFTESHHSAIDVDGTVDVRSGVCIIRTVYVPVCTWLSMLLSRSRVTGSQVCCEFVDWYVRPNSNTRLPLFLFLAACFLLS